MLEHSRSMSNNQLRANSSQAGGTLIVSTVSGLAHKHPIKFSLNIFGLLLLFFAAGFAPTQDQLKAYQPPPSEQINTAFAY
jgi:hypothetical protein